jgi:hypothetical protein
MTHSTKTKARAARRRAWRSLLKTDRTLFSWLAEELLGPEDFMDMNHWCLAFSPYEIDEIDEQR